MGSVLRGDTKPVGKRGRPKKGLFVPKAVYVPCCKDWIWSNWSGHYESCKCGSSAVDQTAYYMRLTGVVVQRMLDKSAAKAEVARRKGEQSDVPAEDSSYQTQYPQFSGWFNARVVRPPTKTQKIRVARADKSVSEGYKYDFDWGDLGINTIIGWKYL